MPTPYTPSLNGVTGDYRWDTSRSSIAAGDPDSEAVLRVLRTPLGRHLPSPTFGLDYNVLGSDGPDADAKIEREVRRALTRIVAVRRMRDLTVSVSRREFNGDIVVVLTVSFRSRSSTVPTKLTQEF